jgi:hypothetical protein
VHALRQCVAQTPNMPKTSRSQTTLSLADEIFIPLFMRQSLVQTFPSEPKVTSGRTALHSYKPLWLLTCLSLRGKVLVRR